MEIKLAIDGKQITFRKSGATMLAYKRQTGREFFSDLSAFLGCVNRDKDGKIISSGDVRDALSSALSAELCDIEYYRDGEVAMMECSVREKYAVQ